MSEMIEVKSGQVWRRKPSGYLYRIVEVEGRSGSSIKLLNLHDPRTSWISKEGLNRKYELTAHGD